ncbi:MAG: cell division protein FtsW [Alphaproteobacteria bacterium]|nr:cell division protein FtsW [Alphaproteobacteria bacterium]
MIGPSRTDTSVLGRWWWTVDRLTLAAIALLMTVGMILVVAASPAVAVRIGVDSFHFVQRQAMFLVPAIGILLLASLLSPLGVRRVGLLAFIAAVGLMIATLMWGPEVNGAHRWLDIAGVTFQPSELAKPAFAIVTAWLLSLQQRLADWRLGVLSASLLVTMLALLAMQPDYGMAAVVGAVWFGQAFLAGLPLVWAVSSVAAGAGGLSAAYFFEPHVTARIDRFLHPESGENFQVQTALNAFTTGGPFGRGPGEGVVKNVLPDAHTDFIFAVVGEEFGMVACILIAATFAFVVLRGLLRLLREPDYFVLLAGCGLLVQFGLQAAINMSVNLRLLPAKGMTLPFLSYGGSSLLALALGMGLLLALTRRRFTELEARWLLGNAAA